MISTQLAHWFLVFPPPAHSYLNCCFNAAKFLGVVGLLPQLDALGLEQRTHLVEYVINL